MKLVIVLVISLVSCVSPNACPKCGSIGVPYPLSTNQDCGDPRYTVYCNNDSFEFKSADGLFYKILSIDPKASKLIIKPAQIQENTCYSSDLNVGGFRLDESLPFNISTHNTVMLFNCSSTILLSPLNCSATSFCRQFEAVVVIKEASVCRDTLCCHYLKDSAMTSHRIRVRVGGCTAYTSVVNLNPAYSSESWNYGIELQWQPPIW